VTGVDGLTRDRVLRLAGVETRDFHPSQPRNPHTGQWIDTGALRRLRDAIGSAIEGATTTWDWRGAHITAPVKGRPVTVTISPIDLASIALMFVPGAQGPAAAVEAARIVTIVSRVRKALAVASAAQTVAGAVSAGHRSVDLDNLAEDRGHPHPGQHYKHGWIPIAVAPVAEVLTADEAARDYGDELDRVEFDDGASVVARSEGMLTIQSDAGDGRATIHSAPSPAEAETWADHIESSVDTDSTVGEVEDGLLVARGDSGDLLLRWPVGDHVSNDPNDHEGIDLRPREVSDFVAALRDMAYVTEDNQNVPDQEDGGEEPPGDETPIPDDLIGRHRSLQLLGVEVRAVAKKGFNPALHPRNPKGSPGGGEFKNLKTKVLDALDSWTALGGSEHGAPGGADPLAGFSQPQLKKAATDLGLNPPKGMKLVPLKALIIAFYHQNASKKDSASIPPVDDGPGPALSPPSESKFELLHDTGLSGDGYAPGGQWGKYGAAGILIQAPGNFTGEPRFLLVQRGPGVTNNKGKWQLPGGALNSKESPYNAAARETVEEVGAPESYLASLAPVGEHVYTHEPTGWKYTTIAAMAPAPFAPIVDGTETSDAKWFTAAEIADMRAEGKLVPKLDKSILPIIEGAKAAHGGVPDVAPRSDGVWTVTQSPPGSGFYVVEQNGVDLGDIVFEGGKWKVFQNKAGIALGTAFATVDEAAAAMMGNPPATQNTAGIAGVTLKGHAHGITAVEFEGWDLGQVEPAAGGGWLAWSLHAGKALGFDYASKDEAVKALVDEHQLWVFAEAAATGLVPTPPAAATKQAGDVVGPHEVFAIGEAAGTVGAVAYSVTSYGSKQRLVRNADTTWSIEKETTPGSGKFFTELDAVTPQNLVNGGDVWYLANPDGSYHPPSLGGSTATAAAATRVPETVSLADMDDMAGDGLFGVPLAYSTNPTNGRLLRIVAHDDEDHPGAGDYSFDMQEQQPDGSWDEGYFTGAPTAGDLLYGHSGGRFENLTWYQPAKTGSAPAGMPPTTTGTSAAPGGPGGGLTLSNVPDQFGSHSKVDNVYLNGVKIGSVEGSYIGQEHQATAADGTYVGVFPTKDAALAALTAAASTGSSKPSSIYDPVQVPASATKAPLSIVTAAMAAWPPTDWTGSATPTLRRVKVPPKGQLAKDAYAYYVDDIPLGTVEHNSGAWFAYDPNGSSTGWGIHKSQGKAVKALVDRFGHVHALIAKGQKEAAAAAAVAQSQAEAKAKMAALRGRVDADLAKLRGRPAKPTAAEKAIYAGDFSQLRRVGLQAGSNEGGVFEAPDGSRWYVKAQKSADHASNEALAVDLYRAAGIDAPEVVVGAGTPGLSGSAHTATRLLETAESDLKARINGDKKGNAADHRYVRRAHEGFAVDAWLANWDVAGANFDNIVSLGGQPVRIDSGGSLLYRAQGEPKGGKFGPVVVEWDTFTDKESTHKASALHDSISSHDMVASADRVKAITPAKIRAMVKARGLDASLAETLIERRKDIMSRAKVEAKKKSTQPFGTGALKEQQALESVPVEMSSAMDVLKSFGLTALDAKAARESLHAYKSNGYKSINKYLYGRGPATEAYNGKTAAEHVRDLDIAFSHSGLTQDIIVYQGSRGPGRLFPPGEWSLVGGMEGKEFTVPAFWSSSVLQKQAESFASEAWGAGGGGNDSTRQSTVMKILVPKGTAVIALDDNAKYSEAEVLLNRGLRYRVVKDYGVQSGVRRLDVEVL